MKVCLQSNYAAVPYPSPVLPEATVSSGGCGVCCASMIIENLLDEDFTPETAAKFSMAAGARVAGGTDMQVLGKALAEKFPLVFSANNARDGLYACLDSGGMAVANVGGDRTGYTGIFSDVGHYVVVSARDGDDVTVLDPGYYSGKFSKAGRLGKVSILGTGVLSCTFDVLDTDCENRSPRYYLFKKEGDALAEIFDNTPAVWEKDSVAWAKETGIITGDENGDLKLHSSLTKAQLCVMLKRFNDRLEK